MISHRDKQWYNTNMDLNVVDLVIVLVIVIASVILHELSHGIVAYWLGDSTAKDSGRLSFNPLSHIDPYMSILVPVVLYLLGAPIFGGAKPVPVDSRNLKWQEWGMALVALAGPFTNLLIAFVSFLIGHFTGIIYSLNGGLFQFIVAELIFINIGFAVFNLIPIPPLDGSRVLYAISPDGFRNILTSLEPYGFILVYLLIFLFGNTFSNVMTYAMEGVFRFFNFLVGQ